MATESQPARRRRLVWLLARDEKGGKP